MLLTFDFETRSELSVKNVGAFAYAEHPSTHVLCMAWQFDRQPVQLWEKGDPVDILIPVFHHVRRGGAVEAHSAEFEFAIWNLAFGRQMQDELEEWGLAA